VADHAGVGIVDSGGIAAVVAAAAGPAGLHLRVRDHLVPSQKAERRWMTCEAISVGELHMGGMAEDDRTGRIGVIGKSLLGREAQLRAP